MKTMFLALSLVAAVAFGSSFVTADVASAKITAGTTTQKNGGGNTPSGKANGVPTITTPATNPAGKAPAGQN